MMQMFIKIRLSDIEGAKRALPNYYNILEGRKNAIYLKSKGMSLDCDLSKSEHELWDIHEKAMLSLRKSEATKNPKTSLLDLKLKLARHMLSKCELCERKCGANRLMGKEGHCHVVESKVSSEFVHWGEEPELVPSHTIFFSGCTFNCAFCQNWDISQNPKSGDAFSPTRVAEIIKRRSDSTRNTNWVGGDPTSNLPFILDTLTYCNVNTPQVWNSNMYLTEKSMKLLDGLIDVYLTDFKYGNSECAKRLSNVDNYWDIVCRNHKIARSQCGVIIRHLVLPGHFKCCTKPILEWIAKNLENVRVNVMDQFRPAYNAYEYEELTERLTREEFKHSYEFALGLGLSLTD
ncbi:MAG: radical SAM protein [Methanomassiliicoccales archaeon]|nr:MAG: radical SAM protein [Methanomassiliicoccales archaeon]